MNQFLLRVRAAIAAFLTTMLALAAVFPTLSHATDLVGATAGELGVSPSGSASYSIPVAVPVGTTGLQPKITLQYDSLAGNGVAGMGWTVGGLAVIGRCPTSYSMDGTAAGSPGLDPVDYDANDKFCLNGQRLVPVSGTYGAPNTEYRTTQEEFSKIVSYGTAGSGPQYFKVWRKSGEILEFGNTADSRIEALGRADVWVWALNKLSDTAGNYETFTYTEDTTDGGFRISRVDYTGNAAQGLSPYNHMDFIYAARLDVSSTYQAGSRITQNQRLTNIKVYADAALFRDYQVTYETTPGLSGRSRPTGIKECAPNAMGGSDCFPPTTFQWSPDGAATLTTLGLTGSQGIPVSPSWSDYNVLASGDFNGDGRTDMYLVKTNASGQASGSTTLTDRVLLADGTGGFQTITVPAASSLVQNFAVAGTGDFNGDGLTDFYAFEIDGDGRKNGTSLDKTYFSNGDGTFSIVTLSAATSARDEDKVMATGDFNGDGLTDLFLAEAKNDGNRNQMRGMSDQQPKVLLATASGTFQSVDITVAAGINIVQFAYFAVSATGDFNGDGLTDMYVMHTDEKLRKFGNTDSDHYWTAKWTPNGSSGTLTFVDTTIPLANSFVGGYGIANSGDFNGDGLVDFYVIKMDKNGRGEGNLQDASWLAKGNLTFQVVTGLSSGSQILDEYKIVGSGDFNGDGLTDAYVMPTEGDHPNHAKESSDDYLLTSKGDGHFSKTSLLGSPGIPQNTMEHYAVKASGDFNGDGLADLYLFKARPDGRSDGNAADYIFQSAWAFPDQLLGVTNGMGINTQLAYKPMTDAAVYTKGTGSTYPVQEVIAPRHVVSEVKADNGVGGQNSQTYAYAGLRAHVNDIGSLGFAKMTVTDQSTGIVTGSSYSQDWAAFTEGLLTSSKTTAPAPYNTIMSEQTVTWAVATKATADGTPLRFRYSPTTTTVKRDLNGALLGTTTESADYSDGAGNFFNNYGFPRQVTASTLSPGTAVTFAKVTDNTYTHDSANWILGRLTAAQVTHQETGKANMVRASSFTYNATTGLLLSETVEPGSTLSYTKANTYDGFGAITALTETWGTQNNSSVKDAGGATATQRVTSYTYDARRRYKATETNPLGHAQSTIYDAVTGVVTSTTGPNGLTTSWPLQDAFGRPAKELRADGTYTLTDRYLCGGAVACPAPAAVKIVTNVYSSTGVASAPTQTAYQDKLYREVRVSTVSLNGAEVNVDTVYDSKGRVTAKSEPFFTGATTVYWTNIQYDLINRPLQTTRPDLGTQTVSYNGFTETSTNELAQSKTVTTDAAGRQASVTDTQGTAIVYAYDAMGQMSSMAVSGVAGTTSSFTYDGRGNKLSDSDPDKGIWTYSYNALGQVASQTDAKGQVTTMTYDLLGRMLSRIDDATAANPASRTATWTYDTAAMGPGGPAAKGKLASVAMPNYAAAYAYDALLRDAGLTETIEGNNYSLSTAYDTASRPLTVTYPSGLTIQNAYNANGYLTGVSNPSSGTAYWTAGSADERGNITAFTLGNGVVTSKAYDVKRGWLNFITSQKPGGPLLQSLTYTFNKIGNLTVRADGEFSANPLTETISYDTLNRLSSSATVQAGAGAWSATVNVTYDVLGNIASRSDVGTYTYGGGACGGGKHAVTSVSGTKTATYCYDANGNMVSGDSRSISYSAFDMPTTIAKGIATTSFFYGPDRARYKRTDVMPEGLATTIYAAGGSYEKISRSDGSLDVKTYVGGFAIVTARTSGGSTTTSTAYTLTDHLGSIDTITDAAGNLTQKMSFDAWGKRRQVSWANLASPLYFDTSITTRGFTGHEEIDQVGLIHMNGRVYDPELGRFISADPFVQDAGNAQSWNRYSYVLNNPLSMTDPTGFFFGLIFKAIGNFVGSVFKAVASMFKALLKIPLIRAVIQIAACAGPQLTATCLAVTGALAIAAGGGIEGAIKAIAFTTASFGVWSAVGSAITGPLATAMGVTEGVMNSAAAGFAVAKGLIHGVVGGALSLAQGGSFIDGFAANAIGAASGVFSNAVSNGNIYADSVLVGAAGGAAAELTGGKFANGFVTSAFANIWNKMAHAPAIPGRPGSIRSAIYMLTYPIAKALGELLGSERTYLTYILQKPGVLQYYVGRASGFGTPADVLYRRLIGHYYFMVAGYTKVTLDQIAYGNAAYAAIRGREQQLVDSFGGIGSYSVANLIRPVSAYNLSGRYYWQESNDSFGPLAPYTGAF